MIIKIIALCTIKKKMSMRPSVMYAGITQKISFLNSQTKACILAACGIKACEDPVKDVLNPLEHSIIDMKSNRRCWLANGENMCDFLDRTENILPPNIIVQIEEYHDRIGAKRKEKKYKPNPLSMYAIIRKKIQALESTTKYLILRACGLQINEDPVQDIMYPLEHSAICMKSNQRTWLEQGKDMIEFRKRTENILKNSGNTAILIDITNYHENLEVIEPNDHSFTIESLYANILQIMVCMTEEMKINIINMCGIQSSNMENIGYTLEHSIICAHTNHRCWLKNGDNMYDFEKRINEFCQSTETSNFDCLLKAINEYHKSLPQQIFM